YHKQGSTSKSRQARDGKQESSSKSRQARVGKQETASKSRQARVGKQESTSKNRIGKQEPIIKKQEQERKQVDESDEQHEQGRRSRQDRVRDYERKSRDRERFKIKGVNVGFNLDGSRVSGYGSVCEAQLCVKIRVDKYRNAWQRTRDLTSGFTSSWFTYSSGDHGIIPTSHFMQVSVHNFVSISL
ncbi:hypothetical protein Tco_0902783, partial [Tanacetum coccineum]